MRHRIAESRREKCHCERTGSLSYIENLEKIPQIIDDTRVNLSERYSAAESNEVK